MTSGRVWGARLAALLAAAIIIPACSAGGSGNVGVSKQSLWNSSAGTGRQPTGTSNFWHNPSDPQYAGVGGAPPLPDPQDVRTYTRPDIYILGLKHPLMVDLTTMKAPLVIFQEDRVFALLNQFRHNTYVTLLGAPPYPPNIDLLNHPGLRQNARAHCKHYAVWHTAVPFPAVNAEGDDFNGRLTKSKLTAVGGAELGLAGFTYASADDVAAFWITTYGQIPPAPAPPGLLLDPTMTTMSIGFWQQGGGTQDYYWSALFAQSVNAIVVLPTLPFGGPGF